MSENTIEIVAEPAFYTKGSPEYHAERERALVKRLEDARKREAEVKAKHAEELRPVHAQMESLGAEVTTRDQEIANARKGVSDTREDIAGKQRLIESLKSEIAVMESAIQRVEENIIPDLERSKADLQKLVSTSHTACAEIHKRWRRRLHEAESDVKHLGLRLTRMQLRRPR